MIERLHRASLRTQVILMLAAAPLVVALLGLTLAPLAVEQAMAGEDPEVVAEAAGAARLLVALVVACAAVAAAGAALVLRESLRSVLDRMHAATSAIAAGDFQHRIASRRGDELGRLAHATDAMAERLERLEEGRRHLLACVSHELRTPLTILRNHAYALHRTEPDPIRQQRLARIDEETVRLAALVDDLVDAASLHAGGLRLQRRECELGERVRAAVERFEREASARGIRLEERGRRRGRSTVLGDADRIDQVLANLLGNAIRHADPGSTIELANWSSGAGRARGVSVRNVGAPIDGTARSRIFEPFEQHGEDVGRMGLGLAIARGIAEAHGGSLDLAEQEDGERVVEFRVAFPAPASRDAQRPAAIPALRRSRMRRGLRRPRPSPALEVGRR